VRYGKVNEDWDKKKYCILLYVFYERMIRLNEGVSETVGVGTRDISFFG
jgi:hypothetical protein